MITEAEFEAEHRGSAYKISREQSPSLRGGVLNPSRVPAKDAGTHCRQSAAALRSRLVHVRDYHPPTWLTAPGVAKKRKAIELKGLPSFRNWRFITLTLDQDLFEECPLSGYLQAAISSGTDRPPARLTAVLASGQMRKLFDFVQVDAFSRQPLFGNPAAPVEVIPSSDGKLFEMTQAPPSYRDVKLSRDAIAGMLGCEEEDLAATPFQVISTGVPWLVVELSSLEAISTLLPDYGCIARECKKLGAAGLTVFAERDDNGPIRIRVRTFAPGEGVPEDPVCGSGNGSVAAFIARHKDTNKTSGSYIAEQGIEIGRDGVVHAAWERAGDSITLRIAGAAAVFATGQLTL